MVNVQLSVMHQQLLTYFLFLNKLFWPGVLIKGYANISHRIHVHLRGDQLIYIFNIVSMGYPTLCVYIHIRMSVKYLCYVVMVSARK